MMAKLKTLPFLFIVIILSWIVTPQSFAQEDDIPDDTRPVDIVLLLDSSGSAADQRELIQRATEFLLDYLEANTDFAGLDYRFSVVGFNQGVLAGSAIPLGRPSDANLEKFFTDTPTVGDTDFKPALSYALDEFIRLKTVETGRIPIVMLMTDGQPARQGQPLPDPELNTYFTELGQTITTAVTDIGLHLFVVAVGDAAPDQARWQNALPSEEQYRYIDNSSNLSEVYWQFLSQFIGGEQDAITPLTADIAQTVSIEPYLDELTFTILKDTPGTEVVIKDPSGSIYTQPPAKGGDDADLHEIYIVPMPDEGDWELTLQGTGGRLLVNRRYPQISLTTENSAVPTNTPFLVYTTIESQSLKEAENLSLWLVDDVENYEEATIKLPFERVEHVGEDLLYEVIVPGVPDPNVYELTPLVFVDDELLTSVQTEGISVKVVALPRITGLTVTQETPDAPFMIEYEIENDEDIADLNPELQIVVNDQPVLVEEFTDYENGGKDTYTEFTPQQEGEYVITLKIEGTSSDGLNFSDTYKVTLAFSFPTPISVPSPTVTPTLTPAATPTIAPQATEQPGQPLPIFPWGRSSILSFFTFLLLLILVILVGLGVYFLYKKGGGAEGRTGEPDSDNPTPTPSGKTEKTINESLDEIGDSTSFTDKERLEKLIIERLRQVTQDVGGATRDVIAALSKLEEMYGDNYYEQYVRPMLDQLRGLEVPVFLKALSFGLIKQWKEDKNAERIVTIIYDKILGLTSNPHVTFVEVAKALESEAGAPILIDFLTNWVKFYRNSDEESYKKISDLDIGYVDSLKQVYSFLHGMNKDRYSYGNEELYKQLESEVAPDETHFRSQNLYLLLRDVKPIFTQPVPSELEAWHKYRNTLEQVFKELTSQEKTYSRLPETKILKDQIKEWLKGAKEVIHTWAEQPEEIGPGKLELELRPTLALISQPDEIQLNREWNYIIRGVLYHVGGTDVEHVRLLSRANGSKPVSVKFEKQKENLKLALNDHIKFMLPQEPVGPVDLSFELEFQTLATIGNANETRSQHEVVKSLSIAPNLDSYQVEEPLESPFVVGFDSGQPLTFEEFERFAVRSAERKVAELVGYLNYSDGPELIVLEGLRQSGKTTIINTVLETIDAIPENHLPKYLVIKINLMEWWEQYIRGKDPIIADYRYLFWLCCSRLGKEKLDSLAKQTERIAVSSTLLQSQQLNGANPFQTFLELIINLKNETGMRPLLILDDADIFHYFDKETSRLMNEITELCYQTQGIVWTANDNRSRPWIDTLRTSFQSNIYARQKTVRTSLIDDQEVGKILVNSGVLVLTPLAKRAAIVFTGGWISLAQLLGDQLIQNINKKVRSDFERGYRLVTVEDIRNVILNFAEVKPQLLDYLQNSFTSYEILLMKLLVKERLVDTDTAILHEIRYKSGWMGREFLREKIQHLSLAEKIDKADCDYLERNWQALFYQLKEKGMLENVTFPGRLSSLIRFKIGWLHAYFDNGPYISCETSSGVNDNDALYSSTF